MEQVAGSQPGVKQVAVHFPQGDTILIYDRSQTTAQKVAQAVLDQRPDLTITIEADRPLP